MSRNTHLIALFCFAAVGCVPDRPAAPPGPQSLSDAEAHQVGREVAGEVEDVAGSFTLGGLLVPSFPSAGITAASSVQPSPTATCPALSPNPPVDTDGDRIPDDLTITFTLPDCSFSHNGATFEVTGTIQVSDLSPTDFGIRVVFTDLKHKVSRDGGAFFSSALSGARQVLKSSSEVSLHDSTTVDLESSDHDAAQMAKAWVVGFVADAGQTFDGLRPLPSGTLTVNGNMSRTRGSTIHSFSVTTVTPLHHDATCTERPAFTAGELTIVKTGPPPDGTVTIHIVFNGCGVHPTVTVEHAAA